MNAKSFARMLSKQSSVAQLLGNESAKRALDALASFFSKRTGMIKTTLDKLPRERQTHFNREIVQLIRATGEIHRAASSKSAAATACSSVADQLSGSPEPSLDLVIANWEAALQPKPKTRAARGNRTKVNTDAFLTELKGIPAREAVIKVEALPQSVTVKDIDAMYDNLVGGKAPGKNKAEKRQSFLRHFINRAQMDAKEHAV